MDTVTPEQHNRFIQILSNWREKHFNEAFFVPVLAVFVGIITGFFAFLLKKMIGGVSLWLHKTFAGDIQWLMIFIPLVGILLTGIFVRYIVRLDITHGVSKLIAKLNNQIYKIKARVMAAPMLASSITLGFGGSAGSEGPIAYTGAAVGSNFAHWFGLSPQMMMVLVGCGAAAGIAGIYKSPIGGFLFALEVLRLELTTISVITVLLSAIVAVMTTYLCSGYSSDLPFDNDHIFSASMMPLFIVLGIFCGLYSFYYSTVMKSMDKRYDKVKNPWLKNLYGGLVLAASIYLFPSLYGEGYNIIGELFAGNLDSLSEGTLIGKFISGTPALLIICVGLLLLKCFAASASNGAGGVAGDFAPTLFAGSIAGLLFALITTSLMPQLELPFGDMVLLGMGGVMAGAIRAPMMALFLTIEMTGCYSLFFPDLIVCGVSFGVIRLLSNRDYFKRRSFFKKIL
ncbi:MAG: chloride channel protein [Paramuribaculum sp.]|nr:chloride channel protein [Paramuribaculum sp.]